MGTLNFDQAIQLRLNTPLSYSRHITPTNIAPKQETRRFVRRYIFRAWGGTWCQMLRTNLFSCLEDTTEGVRRPRNTSGTPPAPTSKGSGRLAAAATGPYPTLGSSSDGTVRPRRPIELGTVNTPVVVASVP